MLKTPFKKDVTIRKNIFLSSEDGSSDRDFVFSKMINVESLANINGIIDFENVEYKPASNNIELDLFFLRYIKNNELPQIKNYIEESFSDYNSRIVKALKSSKSSEMFQTKDSDGNPLPKYDFEKSQSPEQITANKPYVVIDPLVENRKKYPKKEGYPHFYNTFTFPFWENSEAWTNLKYGFNNKAYTYNSFIIIELYDDFNTDGQNRVMTIPVYVSDRYMYREKTSGDIENGSIEQKRPVFNLFEGVDGYSLFFLKNYIKSDFYAKFYFWDALNGTKIQFIPSAKNNLRKKWLQDVETFNQKNLYLKYQLNYEDRSYEIFDYNESSDSFDILCDAHIDLYEFAYDDYWSEFFVLNDQPTDIKIPTNPRQYGDLFLDRTSITKNLVYDTTHALVSEAIKDLPDYEEVSVKYSSGPTYVCYEYDDYAGCIDDAFVTFYDISGSLTGYLPYISNDLNIKNLSLMTKTSNLIIDSLVSSQKRNIGGVIIENKNTLIPYNVKDISFENVKLQTEANKIIIDSYGSLDHKIYNQESKSTEVYTELAFIPTKIGGSSSDFDFTKTVFESHYEDFKERNKQNPLPIATSDTDQQSEDFVNDIDNQLLFASGLLNGGQIQTSNSSKKYTSEEIVNKLKLDKKSKTDMFILTAGVLDSLVKPGEQVITQINFYIGANLAKTFYQIKTLAFTGNLKITFESANDGKEEIINIPINFTLK